VADLNTLLKLQTIIIGMKRFATVEEMETIPKIRRPDPSQKLNTDQIVGQSRWLGYTIGVTAENLMGFQCSAVVGLTPRDEEFLSGNTFNGMWYSTLEDSAEHQRQMSCAPYGSYQSLAVSPITSRRLGNPDICLMYATPGQMMRVIIERRWKYFPLMLFWTWFTVDGCYWIYWHFTDPEALAMMRDVNFPASLSLYGMCGLVWYYQGSLKEFFADTSKALRIWQ